jgi:hypothetical protein
VRGTTGCVCGRGRTRGRRRARRRRRLGQSDIREPNKRD